MITPPQAWHHHDSTCGITMMPLPGITMMPFSEDISRQKGRHTAAAHSGTTADALENRKPAHHSQRTNRRIFELWLACWTMDEIASATGWSQATVASFIKELQLQFLDKSQQASASHATDFDVPIYNVWKQQTKSEGASHFGNSEVRWVDNLLYPYTQRQLAVMFGVSRRTVDEWLDTTSNVKNDTTCDTGSVSDPADYFDPPTRKANDMTITLGSNVTIQTPAGPISGRIVGHEQRDTSRHGCGQLEQFVCVALAAPCDEWRWYPVNSVLA